jgi:hypothetical protein
MKKDYIVFGLLGIIIIIGIILSIVNRNGDIEAPEHSVIAELSPEEILGAVPDHARLFSKENSMVAWSGSKKIIADWVDHGTVDLAAGYALVKDGMLVGGKAVVDMTSIHVQDTGSGDRFDQLAQHLSSAAFFEAETYPIATFLITDVTPTEEEGQFVITGDMTIKETTEPVSFPARVLIGDTNLFITGTFDVDRSLFDVRFGSDSFFNNLGDTVIKDVFTLDFTLVN